MSKLRICIDARTAAPGSGGVRQTIQGLLWGLARLTGDEEYMALVAAGAEQVVAPYYGNRCTSLVWRPRGDRTRSWQQLIRPLVPPALRQALHAARWRLPPHLEVSDGTVERSGAKAIHFTAQGAFQTAVPSVYSFQDIQHVHHPEFFSPGTLRWRKVAFPAFCTQATTVVALTRWGKRDLTEHLGVAPEKVSVIPCASVLGLYGEPDDKKLAEVRRRFELPGAFAFFPAQTWKHKNHLGLVESLALLKRAGLQIKVVCTGHLTEFRSVIEKRARALRVAEQVRFLGFIEDADMAALYRLARMLVFPSLFEGFGMPVVEAFEAGLPVACSNAAALPEVAGDAAVLFDARDPQEMAQAIVQVWEDEDLRHELATRGRSRAARWSWEDVARTYRALYRLVAGLELPDDDRALIEAAR